MFYRFNCDDKDPMLKIKKIVSKDVFDNPFLDIYFCPFFKNQKTFHLQNFTFLYNKLKKVLKELYLSEIVVTLEIL